MSLELGQLLRNRYTIIEVLSHGGMGSIYRGHDESLNYEVAVKENLFTTEEYSRQFRREATILANLRHPNLPRVTDHFVVEGQGQYLVMDYIDGEDLRQWMARMGTVPEDQVVAIGIAICDALTYLHNRHPAVVHRDIKPGNIKITPTDQVFLVDFGLAKIAEAGQATTIGAQALTPGYAPPEQYGQGTESRSDIYALGATLYASLTGKLPEDGLARAMGSAELTPIQTHNPQVSERAAAVIEKAMAVKPEDRYQTADDFKLALINSNAAARRKVADTSTRPVSQTPTNSVPAIDSAVSETRIARTGEPVPPAPGAVPAAVVEKRKGGLNRVVYLIGGLLVIGVLVGAGVMLSGALGKGNSAPLPTLTQAALAATPIGASTSTLSLSTATILPSATLAATATAPTPASGAILAPTDTPAMLAPTLAPSLTPAGTQVGGGQGEIVFAAIRDGQKPQLWLMASDGSNAHALTKVVDGACQPDWSPDGKRIVYISPCARKSDEYPGASLFIMDVDGSGLTSISTTPQGDFDPAWSPDGKMIAFTSLRDRSVHIYSYNLQDGTTKRLSPLTVTDSQPAWSPDSKQLVFVSTRSGANQIWTMNADGSSPKELSLLDWGPAYKPAWSPDGAVIVYNESSELPRLLGQSLADRFTQFDIAKNLRPVADAAYSRDGLWLVYEGVQDNQNHDIFIMDRNGTRVTRLTSDPGFDFQPAWRP